MASSTSSSDNLKILKGAAVLSTLSLASVQLASSALFVPSLLRPLNSSQTGTEPSSRKSSVLNIPSTSDGRLTPQPSESKVFNFSFASSGTYRAVAQQFALFDTLAVSATVPLELFSVAVFGFAAYRARSAGSSLWTHWTAAAALVASVFPVTSVWIRPLVHKIKRLGGDEEKIEPYEDAPPDREAEKANTVEFLGTWGLLNGVRAGILYAAATAGALVYLKE